MPQETFTDEWWEVTHAALKRASELGIEIGMFNSPGWSQAGGPWIEPGQAMRYLASVKAHVRGGGKVEVELPRPSADFQDVRVVAYPAPAVGRAALTAADTRVTVAGTAAGAQCLIDGDPATELLFDGSPEAVIDLVTDADMDLRNITVWPARRPIRAQAELQVKGRTATGQSHRSGSTARTPISRSASTLTPRFRSAWRRPRGASSGS